MAIETERPLEPSARHSADAPLEPEVRAIEPPRGVSLGLRELWAYRELAWFLVLRAVKPRYRQTLLGFGWAVIPPIVLTIFFTLFFYRGINVPSEPGVPYPLFAYSGLAAWQFFAGAVTRGGGSLLANSAFLTKIYFPRLLIPLSTVLSGLFDLLVSLVPLVPLLLWYGYAPSWNLVTLPVFAFLAVLAALAVSLWVAAASVQFRDLGLALPLLVQVWLVATPVIYPVSILPDRLETVAAIANPMTPVVEGFRWAILGRGHVEVGTTLASAGLTLLLLFGALLFFSRLERTYADEI
jgi:lipopolysaccharide transport system permease protein